MPAAISVRAFSALSDGFSRLARIPANPVTASLVARPFVVMKPIAPAVSSRVAFRLTAALATRPKELPSSAPVVLPSWTVACSTR